MTYDKEIPDYALQPARAPQKINAEAIYHRESMTFPKETKTAIFQLEEDLLVPDTKADMGEILLVDGTCKISPKEKSLTPRGDDVVTIKGTVSLQMLYQADDGSRLPISVSTKTSFQYPWQLKPTENMDGIFSCEIKSLEYMVINERKYRVKIALELKAELYAKQEIAFFTGVKDEPLELKKSEIHLSTLSLIKRDQVTMDEFFKGKDGAGTPVQICKENFVIEENYRQVTTEKIVINGFVYVNLLYKAMGDNEVGMGLLHHQQRLEFTQFIPLEKAQRNKKWSGVQIYFSSEDLELSLEKEAEDQEELRFHLKGNIETRVHLYEEYTTDLVIDAYHRQKHFTCGFKTIQLTDMGESVFSEVTMREIIYLPEGQKATEGVYSQSRVIACNCHIEKERLLVKGTVQSSNLWKDEEGFYHNAKVNGDYTSSIDMAGLEKDMMVLCRPIVKNSWVSLVNEKQLELNYTLLLNCESRKEKEISLLQEPAFVDLGKEKEPSMVIVVLGRDESLWDLAKRHRTTEEQIRQVNHLDQDPKSGDKLFLMR